MSKAVDHQSSTLRLSWRNACVLYVVLIVGIMTMPWSEFVAHAHWHKVNWVPFQDAIGSSAFLTNSFVNVIVFTPFGYLYLQSRSRGQKVVILEVILLATLLSASLELYQVYCHGRFPSVTDAMLNAIGGVIGATVALKSNIREVIVR